MKKGIFFKLAAMLFAVLCLTAATVFAQNSGTCGDNATWEYDETTHTLTISGTGAMIDYDNKTPWKNKDIKYIVINDGITHIGAYSFYCNIINVTIPNSVTSIGEEAFYFVNNIEYNGSAEVSPSSAWCRNGYIDGDFIYSDNTKKELLRYIGEDTDVIIPDGVVTIGYAAFTPEPYYYSVITSVIIPESVTSIGKSAFEMTDLTSVTIPKNVTNIGTDAFYCNEKLESVYFMNNPTEFDDFDFFFGSDQIVKCYVSPEYFDICNEKFAGSSYYYTFVMNGGEEYEQGGITYVLSNGIAAVTGHTSDLPDELVIPETITKDGVDYNVTIICNNAFKNCENLTSVIIPKSVKSINSYAFYQCSKLTSITIPEGVKSINSYAFYLCSKLTSITIPEGVKTIGKEAFAFCKGTGITSIIIPESVTSIGERAFHYMGTDNIQWYWYLHPDLFDNKIFSGNDIYQIHVPAEYLEEFNEKYGNNKHYTFIGDIINIGNENITIPAQTYTGKALTPVVKDGDKTLIEGEDYTITLPEGGCINAGEYTVTLKGHNTYYKSAEKTFVINPAPVQIEDTETATDDIILSSVKIWSFNKTIFVENAAQEIVIVDMSGRIVKTIKPESSRTEIQLEKSGVYIVKTGIKTQKVSIQ